MERTKRKHASNTSCSSDSLDDKKSKNPKSDKSTDDFLTKILTCPSCGQCFQSKSDLKNHAKDNHFGDDPNAEAEFKIIYSIYKAVYTGKYSGNVKTRKIIPQCIL